MICSALWGNDFRKGRKWVLSFILKLRPLIIWHTRFYFMNECARFETLKLMSISTNLVSKHTNKWHWLRFISNFTFFLVTNWISQWKGLKRNVSFTYIIKRSWSFRSTQSKKKYYASHWKTPRREWFEYSTNYFWSLDAIEFQRNRRSLASEKLFDWAKHQF